MSAIPDSPLAVVRSLIARSGGWISFEQYLDCVLHHPQAGFYGSGRVQLGAAGDFITAPCLSPLFGQTLARQAAQIIAHSDAYILELGGGNGDLAAAILTQLRADGIACRYAILETSAALRQRQAQTLADFSVEWPDSLPAAFSGLIIANEVLDAIPFGLFVKRNSNWLQRGVTDENALQWQERPPEDDVIRRRLDSLNLPNGYQTEAAPRAEALTRTLCERLQNGAAIFVDYGFGRAEYYHPQRSSGTMMCHRQQRADTDPLAAPGEKDITAHLDFTAIADAGLDGGTQLAGYTTQAHFLLNCGITDLLQAQVTPGALYAKLAAGAHKLLAPHEMGELFKVIAFVKGGMPPLIGFAAGDRRRQL